MLLLLLFPVARSHFKMGSNTLSYNISGMGCSAGGWMHAWGLFRGCKVLRCELVAFGRTYLTKWCSPPGRHVAGVIAVDLARQMLQLFPNSYALVLSTENLTYNW